MEHLPLAAQTTCNSLVLAELLDPRHTSADPCTALHTEHQRQE